MKKGKASSDARIVIERTYRATVDEVWALWTTKDGFESWWGPQGFRAEVHALEARPGGVLRYDMIAATPEMVAEMKKMGQPPSHPVTSRFAEVEKAKRLVLRNVIDFLPGVEPYESDITVELSASGSSVRMVVTLDGMHDATFTKMQEEGFTSQLTKLDTRYG
ncbi:MAG: SRPBCC domain-containing protein [Deltaproteobacteria bacterium]|nr:SRPBCC domain-containing protein [Deltaproteobacteria bacterium]